MPKINLSNQCRRSTEHKHTPAHATSNLVQITHIPTPSQPPNATASPLASFTYSHICHRQPPCLPHTQIHTYATANPLASFIYSHICHCHPCLLHICHYQPPCLLLHIFTPSHIHTYATASLLASFTYATTSLLASSFTYLHIYATASLLAPSLLITMGTHQCYLFLINN